MGVIIFVIFVLHVYGKINVIFCMVWSVGLEIKSSEFEPWLEQKYVSFLFRIFVICRKMKS